MKRRRVLYSMAALVMAAGTILSGSIISAQAVPASPAQVPTTYSALFGLPSDKLFLCTYESDGTPGAPGTVLPVPPESSADAAGKMAHVPGDVVTGVPALQGMIDIDPSTITPGTPEQCEEAKAEHGEVPPNSTKTGTP